VKVANQTTSKKETAFKNETSELTVKIKQPFSKKSRVRLCEVFQKNKKPIA